MESEPTRCPYAGSIIRICKPDEYCCDLGCCPLPPFQFRQVWYYWLVVILIFMLCSTGSWWYRFWLASRFPMSTQILHRITESRRNAPETGRSTFTPPVDPAGVIHHPVVTRVSYHPVRHAVMMHQLWKGTRGMRNAPPPSYTTAPIEECIRVANPSVLSSRGDQLTPYHLYELYGPPPSYDSVIAESQAFALGLSSHAATSHYTVPTLSQNVEASHSGQAVTNLPQYASISDGINALYLPPYTVSSSSRNAAGLDHPVTSLSQNAYLSEQPVTTSSHDAAVSEHAVTIPSQYATVSERAVTTSPQDDMSASPPTERVTACGSPATHSYTSDGGPSSSTSSIH